MNNYQYWQNPYLSQNPAPMSQPVLQTDERIWVQGSEGARAYNVVPNGFVRLWDSTDNVFYEKRADGTGRPFMDVYEYSPKVTPDETKSVSERLRELERRIERMEDYRERKYDADSKSISAVYANDARPESRTGFADDDSFRKGEPVSARRSAEDGESIRESIRQLSEDVRV